MSALPQTAPDAALPCLGRCDLGTPEAMTAWAAGLAPILGPGDTLLLWGDLGAGKTHFARSVIQARLAALDMSEDVPSPSFTLVQIYHAGPLEIWHCDLYRLSGPDEVVELGLDPAFESALCLVEWPDRLADLIPPGAAHLGFRMVPGQDNARTVALHAAPCSALAARLRPFFAP